MSESIWGFSSGDHISTDVVALTPLGGGIAYEAWTAFDERLYAPVVVKVLRPEAVDDDDKRADFAREVELLGRLQHPGVVRLFHADADGEYPHMVLENIDGPNLSTLIGRHGALPVQQLLPLAIELGSVAHYLAGQQVCHLDFKPSNVMMSAPAKVIDFSIAYDQATAAQLTHPVGSDQYMAPEQCEPDGRIGPASDMWGIGATLFRAAVGRRAFTTGSDDGEGADRWPQLIETPRDIPEFVPPAFAELLLACLDPDPVRRPAPSDFVDALEPLMAAMPQARLSGFKVKL